MSNPNTDTDERVDPELDALSWNPTAEEADAYLRGHGVIRKCDHCGQDATLTNDFVSHLLARFGERMREADHAATRMRDFCVRKVREMRDGWQQKLDQAEEYSAVETVMSSRTYASDQIITALQSLTLEQEQQEKSK